MMTFPFVDLHLNTSMFFAMLCCVLTAFEPQSTKLTPKAAKTTFAGHMPFLVTDANHMVQGTSIHYIYNILGQVQNYGDICFNSSVYIANVRLVSQTGCIHHAST